LRESVLNNGEQARQLLPQDVTAAGAPLNPATRREGPSLVLWLSRAVAIGVSLTAFLVLAAWMLVKTPHKSDVMSSDVVMNANTAVGLGIAALALWLLAGPSAPAWRQRESKKEKK
jgi:hypothetical protein